MKNYMRYKKGFGKIWKSPSPYKVVAFSWMLLLDRIQTCSNLAFRHILDPVESCLCVLCGQGEESTTHLFLHCEVAFLIWRKVLNWLYINFIIPHNSFVHFECWSGEAPSNQLNRGFWLIRHATIQMIWKERIDRIFKNQFKNYDEVVDDIKALSWCWALSRLRIASCLFYEW